MKKLILGLIALLLLVCVGALAYLTLGSVDVADSEQAGAQTPSSESAPASEEPTAPAPALATPEKAPEAQPAKLSEGAAAAVQEPVQERTDAAEGRWIFGVVSLPAGTPADEELEVFAVEGDRDPAERVRDFDDGEEPLKDFVARAPVGPTGEFEIPVPDSVDKVWVALRGKYLYAGEGREVDLSAERPEARFAPQLGALVTGRMIVPKDATSAELEDLRGERVVLEPDPTAVMGMGGISTAGTRVRSRRVRLRDDLTYVARGVRNATYDLRVRPDELAAGKSKGFDLAAGQHRVQDLTLTRGGRLSGRVVDERGTPVAEAEIEVEQDPIMFGQGGFEVRQGETGEDGTFELAAVSAGKLQVRVSADGYLRLDEDLELGEGQVVGGRELVLKLGNAVAGSVRWPDGSPAVGTRVDLSFDMSQMAGMGAFNAFNGAGGSGVTDEQGRFRITGLGKGPFTIKAAAKPDEEPAEESEERPRLEPFNIGREVDKGSWRARQDGVKPGTADLALVLVEPQGVGGVVVDDLGEPIPKFKVYARTRAEGLLAGLGADTTSEQVSDEEGRFYLEGMSAGEWELNAQTEGHGRGEYVRVDLPLAEQAPPIKIVLPRSARVSGIVLDTSSSPVAGAAVTPKATMESLSNLDVARGSQQQPSTTSDEQGRFTLENLDPGTVLVVANLEGYAESESQAVDLVPAQHFEGLVLELRTGGGIAGTVFDKEGEPLAGATILTQQPTNVGMQKFATSDPGGRFEFLHLSPGDWQVIHMPGMSAIGKNSEGASDDLTALFGEMKIAMATVKEGEVTEVTLGAPPADPVDLKGRVVAGGEGVPNVVVTFVADGGQGMESLKFTTTDSAGRFATVLNEPGGYVVTVQRTGAVGQQQNVEFLERIPEQPEFELVIELPMASISGKVRGSDGRPAEGVRMSLNVEGPVRNGSFTGGHWAEITTDSDGHYEFTWLRPGTYTVAAGGAFFGGLFGRTDQGRQVRGGVKIAEDQRLEDLNFKMNDPGTLEGTVVDAGGRPVRDASVFVFDEAGRPLERLSTTTTDGSGRFKQEALEPGNYTVVVRGKSLVSSQRTPFRISSGETSRVQVGLEEGTILLVDLSDEEGNPVQCSVTVEDSDGHQVNGIWSMSQLMEAFQGGQFSTTEQRIGPLPAGRYRVMATTSDGRSANKPVSLTGQEERRLKLRLKD